MLTNSELNQIKNFLALYGKKDSQLENAETPLTGFEQLAILQGGKNKIVPLSEIQETIGIELKKDVLTYSDYIKLERPLSNTLYVCTTEDGMTVMQIFLQGLPLLPSSGSTLTLGVNPSTIFLGIDTNVTITGTANPAADTMKILRGSAEIISGSGTTVSTTDTINETTTYTVQASILGYNYTKNQTVTAVNPIYYGSGSGIDNFWANKVQFSTPTTSPYRTYNVTVRNTDDYVYFAVPNSMTIHSASLSGFDFPLDSNVDTSKPGYKIYKSANTYVPDTLSIVIV